MVKSVMPAMESWTAWAIMHGRRLLRRYAHDAKKTPKIAMATIIRPPWYPWASPKIAPETTIPITAFCPSAPGWRWRYPRKIISSKSPAQTPQKDKKPGLKIGVGGNGRKHAHCVIFRFLKIMEIDCPQGNADAEEQKKCDYEKSYRQADVQQEGLHRLPSATDQIAHADATQADAKPYDEDQDGLRDKRASIEHDSRRRPMDCSKFGRTQKRIARDVKHDQQGCHSGAGLERLCRGSGPHDEGSETVTELGAWTAVQCELRS